MKFISDDRGNGTSNPVVDRPVLAPKPQFKEEHEPPEGTLVQVENLEGFVSRRKNIPDGFKDEYAVSMVHSSVVKSYFSQR